MIRKIGYRSAELAMELLVMKQQAEQAAELRSGGSHRKAEGLELVIKQEARGSTSSQVPTREVELSNARCTYEAPCSPGDPIM